MNMCCHNVVQDNWKQVRFEVEWSISQQCINKTSRSSIPVSGILYDGIESSSGILVSALPEHSTVCVRDEWRASEIPTAIVPYDGIPLSSLGFQGQSNVAFHISPLVKHVNTDAINPTFVSTPFVSISDANGDITTHSFYIMGVRYEAQKDSSAESFKFINWAEYRLKLHSSNGFFTSYILRAEQDIRVSFWGAPILTATGKISSIVVHQWNLAEGAVGIVGMKIKSFIGSIPLLSTQLVSI